MNDIENIVTKLSVDHHTLKQLVQGNGSMTGSIMGRLEILENTRERIVGKIEVLEDKPCRIPCVFEEYQKKEEEMSHKKRSYKIGDVANVIQTFLLIVTMVGIFLTLRIGG